MAAEAGKGDSVRPTNHNNYSTNYDLIFRKKPMITYKKFSASWCGPCKSLAAVIDKIKPDYPDVTFEDIDIDENQAMAKEYNIRSVPTLIRFKDGIEVNRFQGAGNAENLKKWLDGWN